MLELTEGTSLHHRQYIQMGGAMNLLLNEAPQKLIEFITSPNVDIPPPVPCKFKGGAVLPKLRFRDSDIENMLSFLNPDIPHGDWVKVGMALHADGRDIRIWVSWSSKGKKFKLGECEKKWRSFKREGITIGTLVNMAKEAGWSLKQNKEVGSTKAHKPSYDHQHVDLYLPIGSEVEIAQRLFVDLEVKYGHIVYAEGYYWVYRLNHWQVLNDKEIRRILHLYDGAAYGNGGSIKLSGNKMEGVLKILPSLFDEEDFFKEKVVGINCLSGFIQFSAHGEPELIDHNPDHRQRFVIDAHWPLNKQTNEKLLFNTLMEGCFNNDEDAEQKVQLLAEIMGAACLCYGTKVKSPKAFVLYGASANNGKSQILKLMRDLLPKEARVSVSPKNFDIDHYKITFVGATLNAVDELSTNAIASDSFKQLVTGDEISGCAKYKAPISFAPQAIHVFSANVLPPFRNGFDKGVKRRLMVIVFNRSIPEKEKVECIAEKIIENEKDYLLSFAVIGAQRLLQNGSYIEPKSSKNALREWVYNADPVQAWFDSCVELAPYFKIAKSTVYKNFELWAQNEGYNKSHLPKPNNFTQRLKSIWPHFKDGKTGKYRYYEGIKLI